MDAVRLFMEIISRTQELHGGDAVCLMEAPEKYVSHIDGHEMLITVPYRYDRCNPPDEAKMLRFLHELLLCCTSYLWRGRCPPGYFSGIEWREQVVLFRITWLASGQPGGGSGGA